MSWSITVIGKPENVAKALEENSAKLDGQTKVEYDAALPHMVALVNLNFGNGDQQQIKIAANGHGYSVNGEQKQSYFTANIESLYAVVV